MKTWKELAIGVQLLVTLLFNNVLLNFDPLMGG